MLRRKRRDKKKMRELEGRLIVPVQVKRKNSGRLGIQLENENQSPPEVRKLQHLADLPSLQ